MKNSFLMATRVVNTNTDSLNSTIETFIRQCVANCKSKGGNNIKVFQGDYGIHMKYDIKDVGHGSKQIPYPWNKRKP